MTENTKHLRKAESKAKLVWWRRLIKRKRKIEGTFDGDTGLFTPSENEAPREGDPPVPDLTPRVPSYFTSRNHTWNLVARACRGEPVPADIAEAFKAEYSKLNERHMLGAVSAAMKREDDAHVAAQREKHAAEKKAVAASTEARIAHKLALIKNLERKVKTLTSKIRAHTRSIAALRRAADRKAKTP